MHKMLEICYQLVGVYVKITTVDCLAIPTLTDTNTVNTRLIAYVNRMSKSQTDRQEDSQSARQTDRDIITEGQTE